VLTQEELHADRAGHVVLVVWLDDGRQRRRSGADLKLGFGSARGLLPGGGSDDLDGVVVDGEVDGADLAPDPTSLDLGRRLALWLGVAVADLDNLPLGPGRRRWRHGLNGSLDGNSKPDWKLVGVDRNKELRWHLGSGQATAQRLHSHAWLMRAAPVLNAT
jgi:hypothetical protein